MIFGLSAFAHHAQENIAAGNHPVNLARMFLYTLLTRSLGDMVFLVSFTLVALYRYMLPAPCDHA